MPENYARNFAAAASRFMSKVRVTETGCWEWTRCLSSTGYGIATIGCKRIGAHRLSWMIHRGPIPEGMSVLHELASRAPETRKGDIMNPGIDADTEDLRAPTQWCRNCDGLFDNPDDANWHTEALGHLTTSDPAKAWQPTRGVCR